MGVAGACIRIQKISLACALFFSFLFFVFISLCCVVWGIVVYGIL